MARILGIRGPGIACSGRIMAELQPRYDHEQPEAKDHAAPGRRRPRHARCRRPRVRAHRPRRARPGALGEAHRRHADPAPGQQGRVLRRCAPAHDRETTASRNTTAPPITRSGSAPSATCWSSRMSLTREEIEAGWPRCGPSTKRPAARRTRKPCRGEQTSPSAQEQGPERRFAPGEPVRVAKRPVLGHCRTPWYLRGKTGVVASVQGTLPQSRAARLSQAGPARPSCSTRSASSRATCGPLCAGPRATISKPTSTSTGSSRRSRSASTDARSRPRS